MSRQERKEKKEQKLRAKLKRQGFSEKEIEQIMELKRKKTKTKGVIGGVVVGVLAATAIVCATVPQIRNSINNFIKKIKGEDKSPEQKENDKQIEQVKELISEEKSEENKKELDDILDRKEKSEDINIPKDVTEEQRQQLEEKKTYLQIVENVNSLYEKHFSPITDNYANSIQSTMTGINNIYKTNDGYVFYVSAINKLGDRYFKSNSFWKIDFDKEFSTFEELNQELEKQSDADLIDMFNEYSRCEDLNNELFRLCSKTYEPNRYSFELLDMTTDLLVDSEFPPTNSTLFVKLTKSNTGSATYFLGKIDYTSESFSVSTYNELLTKFKESNDAQFFGPDRYIFKDINLDWEKFKAQNQTSAEAQTQAIIDEFSTFDENGEMTGFDWNAYRALKEQQEAKDQEKISSQNADQKVELSYSEKELGF